MTVRVTADLYEQVEAQDLAELSPKPRSGAQRVPNASFPNLNLYAKRGNLAAAMAFAVAEMFKDAMAVNPGKVTGPRVTAGLTGFLLEFFFYCHVGPVPAEKAA